MTSKPIVAWSHSALDTFKTCPKKYFHEKIKKDVKFTETEASSYGREVHKAFEEYVKAAQPLPLGMGHYAKYLDKFVAQPGVKYTELRMALTSTFSPTGYFDDDVWFRGQADLIVHDKHKALVIDYKTGKIKDNFDQLDLMAAAAFTLDPQIQHIVAAFFWTKGKTVTSKQYHRNDTLEIWNRFMPQVARLEQAIKTTEFPAKPNFLCKNYCDVKSCPYNGT